MRVEEIESELDVEEDEDDDDDEGVLLDPSYEKRRLVGEKELRRLGMDLVPRNSRREGYEYEEESEFSSEEYLEDGPDRTVAYALQLAMRDKEESLVEKALERIRRAQMLGKTNVRLSKRELDALEKKRRQSQSTNLGGSQRQKEKLARPALDNTRRNKGERAAAGTASKTKTERQRASRPSSSSEHRVPNYYQPANEAYAPPGRSRAPTLEYYGSPVRPSSSSSQARPRTPTTQSLRPQQLNSSPRYQQQYQQPRFYPVPEGSQSQSRRASLSSRNPPPPRALPDDPLWAPPARSSASLVPYASDQSPYPPQSYNPQLDARYGVSPPGGVPVPYDTHYQPVYRVPEEAYGSGPSNPLAAQRERRPAAPGDVETSEDGEDEEDEDDDNDDDDDDDDDEDNGVQVEVPTRPAPTASQPKVSSGSNTRQAARRRKKRR